MNIDEPAKEDSRRRPDIDILRILLTLLILLFHIVLIYTPWGSYYVKDVKSYFEEWQFIAIWFMISMSVWKMPMFFFPDQCLPLTNKNDCPAVQR